MSAEQFDPTYKPGSNRKLSPEEWYCVRCGSRERYASGKCGPCSRLVARKWVQDNMQRTVKKVAEWRKKNPERRKEIERKGERRRRAQNPGQKREAGWKRFGIMAGGVPLAWEVFLRQIDIQNKKCGICSCEISAKACADHNHATGEFRGVLCAACNYALGVAERWPVLALERYLKRIS